MQLAESQASVCLSEECFQQCIDVCLEELDCANDWYVTDIFDFLQLLRLTACEDHGGENMSTRNSE